MRNLRRLVAGTAALAVTLAVAPLANASTGNDLISPGAYGTVDFGDTIRYELAGPTCAQDTVQVVVTAGAELAGAPSTPAPDPLWPGRCEGHAVVPSEADVRGGGWTAGDAVEIRLESSASAVPLRYERFELEHGQLPAGKTPVEATIADPRAEPGDRVVELATGDVIGLGEVDLTGVGSISLRVCTPTPKPHLTPSLIELRQDRADGPVVLGPVDVSSSYPLGDPQTKSNFGWPNCWWLQPWPVENATLGDGATDLFLVMAATATPVQISYIDFNGSGAKNPAVEPADPPDVVPMPLDDQHWSATGCVLENGTARNAGDTSPTGYLPEVTGGLVGPAGCRLDYRTDLENILVRFDVKFGSFADNGGVFVGGREVQMRLAGEFLTGGLFGDAITAANDWAAPDEVDSVRDFSGGGYPAQRLNVNSYDDWNHVEVVQLGARHIVRVNGRTVSDSDTAWPEPAAPYRFAVASQPQFGYDYTFSIRYDNAHFPAISEPSGWSNLVWRNFRYYQCTSASDPVCAGGPSVDGLPRPTN